MGEGSGWIFVLEEGKLVENSLIFVYPKGLPIIIVKKEGRVYAVSNKCVHMGCPLGGGTLDGYTLKCPCHDWKFDITTGECLSGPVTGIRPGEPQKTPARFTGLVMSAIRTHDLKTYPVQIKGDSILVDV